MGHLGTSVKTAFLKGLEALGKSAANLSDAAHHKVSVMNLENRRREVLSAIPKCVMQLWKEGAELPEALSALLSELADVEQKLAEMRPQPEVKPAEETAAEEETEVAEEEAVSEEALEEVCEAPVEEAAVEVPEAEPCCEAEETEETL